MLESIDSYNAIKTNIFPVIDFRTICVDMSDRKETKVIQIELATWICDALETKAKEAGKSEAELIEQGLMLLLELGEGSRTPDSDGFLEKLLQKRFVAFELQMRELVDRLVDRRIAIFADRFTGNSKAIASAPDRLAQKQETPVLVTENKGPVPSVRQLLVGDFVQIRDPDSACYLETVRITKVGTIRATVATDAGEQTFLKRDLRFVRSENSTES